MNESQIYLNRHLEEERDIQEIPESLARPLVENLIFSEDAGEIIAEKDGVKIKLQYSPTNTESILMSLEESKADDSDLKKEIKQYKEWKSITGLVITDQDGKEILNLDDLIKRDSDGKVYGTRRNISMVFALTDKMSIQSPAGTCHYRYDPKLNDQFDNVVLLMSNITSRCTLVTLLHEIAHLERAKIDPERKANQQRYLEYMDTNDIGKLTASEREDPNIEEKVCHEILREERDAWSGALRRIKPLIKSGFLDRDDVLMLIHNRFLQIYSNEFRERLNPNFAEKIIKEVENFVRINFNRLIE